MATTVLNFTQGSKYYTAEFMINSAVNLHLERNEAGALYFRQRSTEEGKYDLINGINWVTSADLVIDASILNPSGVYPIYIMIESATPITYGAVITADDSTVVTFLKKKIELNTNGTTVITADEGYNGLSEVEIVVNVADSTGGGKIKYYLFDTPYDLSTDLGSYDGTPITEYLSEIIPATSLIKTLYSHVASPAVYFDIEVGDTLYGVAIAEMLIKENNNIFSIATFDELKNILFGISDASFMPVTEVSADEFYAL